MAFKIGVVGYMYLYPLVVRDVTRRQPTTAPVVACDRGRGPPTVIVDLESGDGDDLGNREAVAIVAAMSADAFFAYAAELLIVHPPSFQDHPTLAQLQLVGFVAGQPFDLDATPPIVRDALRAAFEVALDRVDGLRGLVARPRYEIGQHSA